MTKTNLMQAILATRQVKTSLFWAYKEAKQELVPWAHTFLCLSLHLTGIPKASGEGLR